MLDTVDSLCARRVRLRAFMITILVVIGAGLGVSPPAGAAGGVNPDLAAKCGINVMLVLDESGSIASAGATQKVRDGAMAFIRSLKDTGSQVAIVEFNTSARKVRGYTPVTSDNAGETTNPANVFYNYLRTGYSPTGLTNWEDALDEVVAANAGTGDWAGSPDADLVVFFTDGNPTTSNTSGDDYLVAVPKANAVKDAGSHMFVVGVGSITESRIIGISGSDRYPSPMTDFAKADYTLVQSFTDLEAALKNIATQLCKSSITITKEVDDGQGYRPAAGWTFAALPTMSAGSYAWVQPPGVGTGARSQATDSLGTATFQWKPDRPTATASVQVTETQKPGYSLTGVSCKKNGVAVPDPTVTGTAFTIGGIASTDIITCTVRNQRQTGSIELVKAWSGTGGQTTLRIGTKVDGQDVDSQLTGAGGAGPLTTGQSTVPTGTYYVSESGGLENYSSALACTRNGESFSPLAGGQVSVGKDDRVVCTFTNTRKRGSIELRKAWSGTGGQTLLRIGTAENGSQVDAQQTGANGAGPLTTGENAVDTGTYYVSESGGLENYASALACTRNGQSFSPSAGGQVSVGQGEKVVCTFTNTRKTGTLILEKDLAPASDPGRFELRHDGTAATVDRAGGGTAFGDGDRSRAITVDANDPVALSETAVDAAHPLSDYDRGLTCSVAGALRDGNVTVAPNQTVTCTFTNARRGTVTVRKVVSNPPSGEADSFDFVTNLPPTGGGEGIQPIKAGDPSNTFSLENGQRTSVQTGSSGTFYVTERDATDVGPGYRLTDLTCSSADGAPVAAVAVGTMRDDGFDQGASAGLEPGERTVRIIVEPGSNVTCTFTNKAITGLQVVVKNPKTQAVYLDQTATYTYEVTNTGTSDLTDLVVSDDRCTVDMGQEPVRRQADGSGGFVADTTPGVMNPGDRWTYTCSVAASDPRLFGDGTTTSGPVTNTVIVRATDELGRQTPPATDTAQTTLLVPGIAIDKTVAPGSGAPVAGDPVVFDLAVTNTGNTALVSVNVDDPKCSSLTGPDRGSDTTPDQLDPGETWRYRCTVQTTAADAGTTLVNRATVTGTDTPGGRTPTASDEAQVPVGAPPVTPPPPPVSPPPASPPVAGESPAPTGAQGTAGYQTRLVRGRARLRGSVGCVVTPYAQAGVTGTNIKQVTFYVNGKKYRTLKKPNRGKTYLIKLRTARLRYRTYKVVAKVVFVKGAVPARKTLDSQFAKCRPRRQVLPNFTG